MPAKNLIQISLHVSPEQKRVIDAAITRAHSKQSAFIRQCIREHLDARGVEFPADPPVGQGMKKL